MGGLIYEGITDNPRTRLDLHIIPIFPVFILGPCTPPLSASRVHTRAHHHDSRELGSIISRRRVSRQSLPAEGEDRVREEFVRGSESFLLLLHPSLYILARVTFSKYRLRTRRLSLLLHDPLSSFQFQIHPPTRAYRDKSDGIKRWKEKGHRCFVVSCHKLFARKTKRRRIPFLNYDCKS